MKPLLCVAASLAGSLLFVPRADAQPILGRIEGLVRDQIDAARTRPAAESGYLGLIGDDSDEGGRGVRVIEVYPDQAAAKAGLREGDLIKKIEGRQIRGMDSLGEALAGKPPGARLTVAIERDGTDQVVNVTLGKRPATMPPAESLPEPAPEPLTPPGLSPPKLGVRTVPVTEEVRKQQGLVDREGGQVVSVAVGSPAERAAIPLGAVITAIDGHIVHTPQDLARLVRERQRPAIEVTYLFGGETTRKMVQLMSVPPAEEGPLLEERSRPLQPAPVEAAPVPDLSGHGAKIEALERRIAELEARLKALEGTPAPVAPPEPKLFDAQPDRPSEAAPAESPPTESVPEE